jgi:hypothetical protein
MSSQPTRPGTNENSETEKIILNRLASLDKEPIMDAREAIAEIRRKLEHPVPR